MSVEHHLLRLAQVDPVEQHAAVTKPDEGSLLQSAQGHAAEQDDTSAAPVELVGLTRSKAQLNVGRRRRMPALFGPSPGVAPRDPTVEGPHRLP